MISYDTIFELDEIGFVGGTDKVFTFTAYSEDGSSLLNISGANIRWELFLSEDYSKAILSKTGLITGTHTFTVSIENTDTQYLYGEFVQKVTITDYAGQIFIYQGKVTISELIGSGGIGIFI